MDNLLILLLVPLIGALVSAFTKSSGAAKAIALAVTILNLGLTVPFLLNFQQTGVIQFAQFHEWIVDFGVNFYIGLDGINIIFVLLTNLLLPLIVLSSFSHNHKGGFYGLVLAMQAGMLLTFLAFDAFTFYVGWEIALIPIYFINALWGGEDKIRVNIKFFIYTFFGSLLMLVAILYLYLQTPTENFSYQSFYNLALGAESEKWIFWAFFVAFAIKLPIFPFHTWQPDTYTAAPTTGTMLLAGVMLKMGGFGVLRWLVPIAPGGFLVYSNLVVTMCVIGVVYASIIAFQQSNAKRLIAYSSIAHVGLIAAGIFVWNIYGLQGAILQMFNHGISVVGLFFIIDILQRRTGTLNIQEMGGIAKRAPRLAVFFMIIVMGAIGLPLTNGFIGEFMLLNGIYQFNPWYAGFAGLTIILGAVYMLRMYQKVMFGPLTPRAEKFEDVKGVDLLVLSIITLLILVIGIYPQPLLDLSEPAVFQWMDMVNEEIGF